MRIRIETALKPEFPDFRGEGICRKLKKKLECVSLQVRTADAYVLKGQFDRRIAGKALSCLSDPVSQTAVIDAPAISDFDWVIERTFLPGVTDNAAQTAAETLKDALREYYPEDLSIFTVLVIYIHGKARKTSLEGSLAGLGNPLVHRFFISSRKEWKPHGILLPEVKLDTDVQNEVVSLELSDGELIELNRAMHWSLDVRELHAVRDYFCDTRTREARHEIGLDAPVRCEMEIIAQTWSEHCKHKEFNALIDYRDLDTDKHNIIDGLYKTFIKNATQEIYSKLQNRGCNWLVKVFDDNAGIVRFNESKYFVWKVETHNSPSALEPYGGALTGIVGVNRDPAGTGRIGAKLLFNTDVFCFASPDYKGRLLPGMLHPRTVFEGVRLGVEHGGNKSGIPTINGGIVFDDRYKAKPLVYCGTGAVMPAEAGGMDTKDKIIRPGDKIVMIGGRVGKDGIHGATFSSREIDETSPSSAVQIGDPITQKKMLDFLQEIKEKRWLNAITDNGAGGLSSSVGELAVISGGAQVELEKVPLKYPGLQPWEIFVSESQERMTAAVRPEYAEEFIEAADRRGVEATEIGVFTDTGILDVRYHGERAAYLHLNFLHEGVPRKHMQAEWKRTETDESIPGVVNFNEELLKLLSSYNICSREPVVRRYDHEVKGRTIIKPLSGKENAGHNDAAVMRPGFEDYEGIAVANGICPKYGDIDPYNSAAGAVDEAVRQILAVGGRLPDMDNGWDDMWSLNDNFCVPDCAYDPDKNPDGKMKLGKLVRMCMGLKDAVLAYGVPCTSGKDSMKNDFVYGDEKVSVPHTLLISAAAKVSDVRKCITADFKKPGDIIYVVGATRNELGGTEFMKLHGKTGNKAPKVFFNEFKRYYELMSQAAEKELMNSCHDCSDGGLAAALAECAIGGKLGCRIMLDKVPCEQKARDNVILMFAESHGRFVVTVDKEKDAAFRKTMEGAPFGRIGEVTEEPLFRVKGLQDEAIVNAELGVLEEAWKKPLRWIGL